jgi:hypothetical protein
METLVKRLMEVHTGPQRRPNSPIVTRWSLILESYRRIQEVVVENARVMARTNIQLLAINNTTLILWQVIFVFLCYFLCYFYFIYVIEAYDFTGVL